jgi:hypothetical protein
MELGKFTEVSRGVEFQQSDEPWRLPAGIEFIDENGGGPRVRLRKLPKQTRENRRRFCETNPILSTSWRSFNASDRSHLRERRGGSCNRMEG